jgi:hypothetical protein
LTVISPTPPSIATVVPAGMPRIPTACTTAGMPSCEARIAVWLVGPPASVMIPRQVSAVRVAVSAGARSCAARTDGTVSVGTPGSGWPSSRATARSRTSRRSVTRSAM